MFYCNYNARENMREVVEYNGAARKAANGYFIHAGAMHVSDLFTSVDDALKSWGKYSSKPVILPDGTETTPSRYFGMEDANDVFIPWYDVKSELWPGETA